MKRLLLGSLLFVAPLKAEEINDTWKELSKYRPVSAIKAAGTVGLMYYSALAMKKHADESYKALNTNNQDFYLAVREAVPAGGMTYVTWVLFWDYLRPQLKHALAIK